MMFGHHLPHAVTKTHRVGSKSQTVEAYDGQLRWLLWPVIQDHDCISHHYSGATSHIIAAIAFLWLIMIIDSIGNFANITMVTINFLWLIKYSKLAQLWL